MRNFFLYLCCILFTVGIQAQELNCNVTVNAQFTGNENLSVFQSLEKQLNEFVNTTNWTSKKFAAQELINCNMEININSQNGSNFNATLQIQSSRPVFGSSYTTPIYNYNDKDFAFTYLQFQNLIYNPNQFQSNLVSVLAFHIYMILGLDADTFELNGGNAYFEQALTIANYSQQENYKGWKLEDGLQSRLALINSITSTTFNPYRELLYTYHRKGLDEMSNNLKEAKQTIGNSLNLLNKINQLRPNSFLVRTFFDAKADELEQVFTGGPATDVVSVIETLNKVAPMYTSNWRNIKN